jgi:hypothetical protein
MARSHRRQLRHRKQLTPGRAERSGPVQFLVGQRSQDCVGPLAVFPQQRHRVGHAHVGPLLGVGDVVPVDVVVGVGHATAGGHGPQPACPLSVALGHVMEHHTHRPFLAGNHGAPWGLRTRLGKGDGRIVRGRKLVGQGGSALTRHGRSPAISSAAPRSRARRAPFGRGLHASRCSRALTGVGTPWSAPRRTISPLRNSASIDPVPRARLCQLEPPPLAPTSWRASAGDRPAARGPPRRCHIDPGRGQGLLPSRWASLASALYRPSGPHSASTALARFMRSLRYFQRMMSGRATDWNVVASRASAMACPTWSSTPDGGSDPGRAGPRPAPSGPGSRRAAGGWRAHDAHAIGVGEAPQHPALVLHAVLHADDGRLRWGHGHQLGQRVLGVLTLHASRTTVSSAHVPPPRGRSPLGWAA